MVAMVGRRLEHLVRVHGRVVPHRRALEAAGVPTARPGPDSATVDLDVDHDGAWRVLAVRSPADWTPSTRRDAVALAVSVALGAGLVGPLRVTVRSRDDLRWVTARTGSRCRRARRAPRPPSRSADARGPDGTGRPRDSRRAGG